MYWLSCSLLAVFVASLKAEKVKTSENSWDLTKFTSLVAFGDSYTDESRYGYFAAHNGSAPPAGWVDPEVRLIHPTLCSNSFYAYIRALVPLMEV